VYEEAVRSHFSRHSEHLAVQIYRQLTAAEDGLNSAAFVETMMHYSAPPELEYRSSPQDKLTRAIGSTAQLTGFFSALRDFAEHTGFEAFFKSQQSFYDELAREVHTPALALAAKLQRDDGTQLQSANFIVAPLLPNSTMSTCLSAGSEDPEARLILGLRDGVAATFKRPAQFSDAFKKFAQTRCKFVYAGSSAN
jgi:hypothetical protein